MATNQVRKVVAHRNASRSGWLRVGFAVSIVFGAGGDVPAQTLTAHRITAATALDDLFSGSDSIGGIGDWYLSNGVIEAVIDDVGFQVDVFHATGALLPIRNYGFSGGAVVDLALVGRNNDQLTWLGQGVTVAGDQPIVYIPAAFFFDDPALPSLIARVDTDGQVASLSVYGFVVLSPKATSGRVKVRTDYEVRAGESFLRIRTEVDNETLDDIDLRAISDSISLGAGGMLSFSPSPQRGFNLAELDTLMPFASVVGRLRPDHGIVDATAWLETGEVSYTVYSVEETLLRATVDAFTLQIGPDVGASPMVPGASIVYERRVTVGDRNDVSASAGAAIAEAASDFAAVVGEARGRLVVSDGFPFRASVEITLVDLDESTPERDTFLSELGDDSPVPVSHVEVASDGDGRFQTILPSGRYEMVVRAGDRGVEGPLLFSVPPDGVVDVGDIALSSLARLVFFVHQEDVAGDVPIPAKIVIRGVNGTPDPAFGDPIQVGGFGAAIVEFAQHAIPAAAMTYTVSGEGEVFVPPGDYRVFATRGMEYSLAAEDISLGSGETGTVRLRLRKVIDTSGYVSADFHVHAAASPDSSVPPLHRVMNFAAEGVQLIVSTDHNAITDYQPLIEALGLAASLTSIVGVEASIGPSAPGVPSRGHWNAWPHPLFPRTRRDGAPEEAFVEPNVVYDRLRGAGASVIQLNHPSRPVLGYLHLQKFDPALAVDDPVNGFLLRQSITGTGTQNLDFDAIEIYNGGGSWSAIVDTRDAWFSLLNQGIYKAGTAVTDTHTVALGHGGFPRTYVAMDVSDMRAFDEVEFNDSLKSLRAFGTSGPFLDVRAVSPTGATAGIGATLTASDGFALEVHVRAPCWVPVEEVRLYANGVLSRRLAVESRCNSVDRFSMSIALDPPIDTHYVVEAGQKTPEDPDEPPPRPLGPMRVVAPGYYSFAFSNPIFVDVNGNGVFDPPGVAPASGGELASK